MQHASELPKAPVRFGPAFKDGVVRFQLWAPGVAHVALGLNEGPPRAMTRDADGTWVISCPAKSGMRYRFMVDGTPYPDPASHCQPDDVSGPSQLVDAANFPWQDTAWQGRPWTETIIYEVHAGLMGGFAGLRTRLPRLAALGITAIELMPIADFAGTRNWGYDGVFPFAPDSAYGTPDELRALIDAAHGNGLMVFLDVVYNHFGPEGNYLPAYAPQFFDAATPTPWGAAIDFHQPAVRAFFTENALYWLEQFRFDGLRLDAVHAILDRSWLQEMARIIRARQPGRHIHLMLENEHNDAALLQTDFTAQWNDDFHNTLHVLLTGESHAYYAGFADRPAEKLARCLEEGFVYQGETPPGENAGPRGQPSAHLAPTSFISFLQNHDQTGNRAFGDRLTMLARPSALRAAMALLLLGPQIPMLFMGEEYGAREPFLFFTDFHGELARAVRQGRRREFAHAPGFAQGHDTAEIPDPNDAKTWAASRWSENAPDAAEWFALIRGLLALRHSRIVPHLFGARAQGATAIGRAAVRAHWRLADGTTLTIATNLDTNQVQTALPPAEPLFGRHTQDDALPGDTTLAWITPTSQVL
jgi:maltooligosyltrehalose trehalohydrolase